MPDDDQLDQIPDPLGPPSSIYEALTRAKSRIGIIGKGDRNKEQDYAFRGIDSILNRAGPILTELGVVISPRHRVISDTPITSRSGTPGYRVVIETKWEFSISLGSFVTARTIGEAIDYSDKAFNKAQTQSFKNALAQVLSIPTGEPDPDSESPERGPDRPALTTAEEILRILGSVHGLGAQQARSYARRALESLDLSHPVPEDRIGDVVEAAVRIHDSDTAPFEDDVDDDSDDAEDDPSSGYGS